MTPRLPRGVATLLAAALIAACSPASGMRDQTSSTPCSVSSPKAIELFGDGTHELRFGGSLASPLWIASAPAGTKGELWAYRTDDPQFFVELDAQRLGGGERVRVLLLRTGTAIPPIAWPGGGRGYLYGAAERRSAFTPTGCWRVSVIGGRTEDEVVVEVR